ncbi:MAG: histone deacetylase [Thermoplasmatales archaeon]|nr:histone deacetylase [Thermoplasmatales archaeon]
MTIVYSERLLEHSQWPDHPESPLRLRTLRKKLEKEGLWDGIVEPVPIDDEKVLAVHAPEHLEKLRKGGNYPVDPDTFLRDETYELAMLSAAVAVTAVKEALKGNPSVGLTRPPGHHAKSNHMGGFCYLNNAAIAAASAGVRTVIIDLDAHHCNGTEEIFYERDDVLVISLHEANYYWDSGYMEDSGEGSGKNYNINIPIPAHSGNETYHMAIDEIVLPVLRQYGPELVLVSLGVDAHYCETNAHMQVNTQGYVGMCRKLFDACPDGRIAFILEGGYHLRATAEVVAGVIAMFRGIELKPEYAEEKEENGRGREEILKIKEYLSAHWNL